MIKTDAGTITEGAKDNHSLSPKKIRHPRAWELDFLRGFAIIMVVWDHFMYDSAYMFGYLWQQGGNPSLVGFADFAQTYFTSPLRNFWWPFFVFVFFFVSGICTAFSKNNFARGLKLGIVAVALSGATYIVQYVLEIGDAFILFGVLHCLASCILLYAVIEFVMRLINRRKNKWVLPAVCLAVTIIAFVLNSIYNVPLRDVIQNYATVETDSSIAGLFVFDYDWWTADYFPLLPFFWFFMLGATIGHLFYRNKKSLLPKLDGKWHAFFSIPGKYSLIIYLASQVLVVGVLALVTYLVMGELAF